MLGVFQLSKNIIDEIRALLKESEKNEDSAAAGYDDGWYSGEVNAYSKVLVLLEKEEQ